MIDGVLSGEFQGNILKFLWAIYPHLPVETFMGIINLSSQNKMWELDSMIAKTPRGAQLCGLRGGNSAWGEREGVYLEPWEWWVEDFRARAAAEVKPSFTLGGGGDADISLVVEIIFNNTYLEYVTLSSWNV